MTIEIRLLDEGDAHLLTRVATGTFDNPVDPDGTREFLADPRHHLAVAIDDGTIVAFVSGVHYAHPDKRFPEMWINEAQVAPGYRRRGLGTAVMNAILAKARALECTEAWLITETHNEPANRLYTSMGASEGPHDGVVYTYDVGPGHPVSRRSLLVVLGASGVGKTAAVRVLGEREEAGLAIHHFDGIGVPDPDAMLRDHGGPDAWQADATRLWIERIDAAGEPRVVLEGQTRPSFVLPALADHVALRARIVLLECSPDVRAERLGGRGQRSLATEEMERWAGYLRGQADALSLPVIDTGSTSVAEVADALHEHLPPLPKPDRPG